MFDGCPVGCLMVVLQLCCSLPVTVLQYSCDTDLAPLGAARFMNPGGRVGLHPRLRLFVDPL